jgi:serine/threonine protein kinase
MTTGTLQLESYFGPYYLEKLIAIGGMAEIYLARTRGLAGFEKQLVLKVIQPEFAGNDQFVQMLVDEAKVSVGLNHPNIAQTFDLGKISNSYFISMEYVDGADFFQILKGLSDMEVDIPIDAAVYVVHEALCGLDYAHNKHDATGKALQIIHRDISPQNILLSRHGEVKIVDFGIAKAANLSHKTRAGVIKGKLVYMSPEQAWGDKVDHRTDIFSAGIVLYEALTMGSLYLEKNPAKLLERVRRAAIDPPSRRRPEIPGELDVLVMKALAPRPADRYESANEFAEVLADYQRRTAPEFSEQELGSLVESVLAGEKPRAAAGPQASQTGEMMLREDFAPQEHSMIFSAEDLMESSPNLASVRPPSRAAGGPTPGRGVPAQGAYAGRQVAKLVLLDGEREGEPFVIEDQFVVGRTGDLRLGDARVSRRHAIIKRQTRGFVVEDLKSANGTYLNGTKIDRPCALQTGDVIRVGPFEMRFTLEHEVTEAVPVPVPSRAPAAPSPAAAAPSPSPAFSRPGTSQKAVATPRPPTGPQSSAGPRSEGPRVSLSMGAESLTLPVGASLRLAHTLDVGEIKLEAETATLVRKPDGYWLEPAAGRETVLHNGRKVTGPVQVAAGDKVQVGPVQLEFLGEG